MAPNKPLCVNKSKYRLIKIDDCKKVTIVFGK